MEPLFQRRDENDVLRSLLLKLDSHSPGELGHASRVAVYSAATAYRLGMRAGELMHIRWAAELHDIGKLEVPADFLSKTEPLASDQVEVIRSHATKYDAILAGTDFLRPAFESIRRHHERWDGAGYPDGLRGESIPLGARIIAVAEAFDFLTIPPAWREPRAGTDALAEIERGAGSQFDPDVQRAFTEIQPLIQPLGLPPT